MTLKQVHGRQTSYKPEVPNKVTMSARHLKTSPTSSSKLRLCKVWKTLKLIKELTSEKKKMICQFNSCQNHLGFPFQNAWNCCDLAINYGQGYRKWYQYLCNRQSSVSKTIIQSLTCIRLMVLKKIRTWKFLSHCTLSTHIVFTLVVWHFLQESLVDKLIKLVL